MLRKVVHDSILCCLSDTLKDLDGALGPDESFPLLVPMPYVLQDRLLQLLDAGPTAAPNTFVGDFGKPTLD